jgi:small basic protein (TIGR04137 family)
MTLDKSLKVNRKLARARSVLSRPERIAKLAELERWNEGDPVFGLPKVRVMKLALKKKKKAKKEGEEGEAGAAEGAAAAPAAGASAAAPAGKGKTAGKTAGKAAGKSASSK